MSAGQSSSHSPKAHQPLTFYDVATVAPAASHSAHQEAGTPRLPHGKSALRTPSHDQRPSLHIATSLPSTAPRSSRPITVPGTPSARTGPPRSLSYQFTPSNSPIGTYFTTLDGQPEVEEPFENDLAEQPQPASQQPRLHRRQPTFRGALELVSSPVDREPTDRKGKGREIRVQDDSRTSPRWQPSMDGKSTIVFVEPQGLEQAPAHKRSLSRQNTVGFVEQDDPLSKELSPTDIRRAQSPLARSIKRSSGSDKWNKLRALIPSVIRQLSPPATHAVAPPEVNIIDELITGGLSNLMLGLWVERDDKNHRRIPVLLHRLRIRISDSLHPLHAHKAVFRIECEYANGAARWVIYRQLRDFISLHTHYTISNAFSSHKDKLPEFPRTTLPYFNFLKMASGGAQVRQADFALSQREALENYLIKLIRAVMFHPSSNRLSGFLEVSALFISLAQSGGVQYKAGFLRLETSGNIPGPGRKATSRRDRKQSRWCTVRDSCLVILEEPGELVVLDVFLLDSSFEISRPVRYYRKGLHLLRPEPADREFHAAGRTHESAVPPQTDADRASIKGSFTGKLGRALNICLQSTPKKNNVEDQEKLPPRSGHARHDTASSGSSVVSNFTPAPMLDPSTHAQPLLVSPQQSEQEQSQQGNQISTDNEQRKRKKRTQDVSKHTFYVENSQMRLKLFARNERQMLQWITALEKAAAACLFTTKNRFGSFAPIRTNVAAQWLVDGRDYMWNLARALTMAKETIYIHDWWLSPEVQLRRPGKDKYRLDKVLERKAKQGVKIHVILYQEVSSRTTPTDSNYAKQKLSCLHENIMIQRSPSHFQTGTFYWAHHEKLCVIDQTIAFMGGIDLCFGRWDTPQHVLVDNSELSPDNAEIWPGKDYSNPRVLDFHALHKPEEDMYDRSKVPRMPWHDVGMQVVGQPARDLARHFVERWNWLLRIKNHTRLMPFLLPPPEFRPTDLETMGLTGTCEMQICRSAGPWSLGTPNRVEHSIQDAYIAAIDNSERFVYIENQFFISSTVINDVRVENGIADALVRRIIRAKREGTTWKCCIMIPLFPGFPYPVDHGDASAIRIIIDCQNRTLFRGGNSIYDRLREEDIEPEDYIRVFSLRNWAKLRDGALTTEIVYIHAKICVVDDRLAIIGSANINERSQRGDRDSELAAVIRDTDMIDGTMAGSPFKVGRFAHSLRVRLMREHVGVDVDALTDEDYGSHEEESYRERAHEKWDPNAEQEPPGHQFTHAVYGRPLHDVFHTAAHGIKEGALAVEHAVVEPVSKVFHSSVPDSDVQDPDPKAKEPSLQDGQALCPLDEEKFVGFTSVAVPSVEVKGPKPRPAVLEAEGPSNADQSSAREDQKSNSTIDTSFNTHTTGCEGVNGKPKTASDASHSASDLSDWTEDKSKYKQTSPRKQRHLHKSKSKASIRTPAPHIHADDFEDPISDEFWEDIWVACAEHNTEIYRKVFHTVPDDTVTTWKEYKHFVAQHERFSRTSKGSSPSIPSSLGESAENGPNPRLESVEELHGRDEKESEWSQIPSMPKPHHAQDKEQDKGKSARGPYPFDKAEYAEMESMLKHVRGHLVLHPTHFLEGEDDGKNFLFNADRLLPLPIYN